MLTLTFNTQIQRFMFTTFLKIFLSIVFFLYFMIYMYCEKVKFLILIDEIIAILYLDLIFVLCIYVCIYDCVIHCKIYKLLK